MDAPFDSTFNKKQTTTFKKLSSKPRPLPQDLDISSDESSPDIHITQLHTIQHIPVNNLPVNNNVPTITEIPKPQPIRSSPQQPQKIIPTQPPTIISHFETQHRDFDYSKTKPTYKPSTFELPSIFDQTFANQVKKIKEEKKIRKPVTSGVKQQEEFKETSYQGFRQSFNLDEIMQNKEESPKPQYQEEDEEDKGGKKKRPQRGQRRQPQPQPQPRQQQQQKSKRKQQTTQVQQSEEDQGDQDGTYKMVGKKHKNEKYFYLIMKANGTKVWKDAHNLIKKGYQEDIDRYEDCLKNRSEIAILKSKIKQIMDSKCYYLKSHSISDGKLEKVNKIPFKGSDYLKRYEEQEYRILRKVEIPSQIEPAEQDEEIQTEILDCDKLNMNRTIPECKPNLYESWDEEEEKKKEVKSVKILNHVGKTKETIEFTVQKGKSRVSMKLNEIRKLHPKELAVYFKETINLKKQKLVYA